MKEKFDLHIHSNLSDGTLSPIEIIDEAFNNGVNTISITDHDTIDAYSDELYNYAKIKNINLINGVEISTKFNGNGIHILGYDFDINNKDLLNKLYILKNARYNYLNKVSLKLKQLGYFIDVDKLSKLDIVTKVHIALDIINNSKNKDLLIKNFNKIPNKGEFIETILNEGCPAFVVKDSITPKEAAEIIRKANGKVVLAHPVAYKYEDGLTDEDILRIILDINADAIESNYIYVDCNNNLINEIDKWNEFADCYNLIKTTGSDFHTYDGIHPEIGAINDFLLKNNYNFNIKKLAITLFKSD